MTAMVSRAAAEAVRQVVLTMFPSSTPVLHSAEHEGMEKGQWSIAWEGWTGEYEWPCLVGEAQHVTPSVFPVGVFVEPMTSWSLGVYPAW